MIQLTKRVITDHEPALLPVSVIVALLLPLTTVTTNVRPSITITVDNMNNIVEGDNITITCESIGNPLPTIIWSRTNGARVLVVDSGNYTESQNASKVSRNLTITNTSREDTGVYTCSANNSVGSVSSNVSITVQYQAEIIDEVIGYDILENETNPVTLTCGATGDPVPTISWYFDDMLLTGGIDFIITTTVREKLIESSLTIVNPQFVGLYVCVAENVIGSNIRMFTINAQPIFPVPIDNITIEIIEGCPEETDLNYKIAWPFTEATTKATNSCPNGTGVAVRLCRSIDQWETPIITNCSSYEYVALLALRIQVEQAESATAVASGLNQLTSQLAIVTNKTDEKTSSYPADLINANSLLEFSLETIERNPNILNSNEIVQNIADCISNMLNPYNFAGWIELEIMNPDQSQELLNNSEKFALLLAENLEVAGLSRTIESENIIIVAELVDPNNITDINFPGSNLNLTLNNSLFIPASYIEQRFRQQSDMIGIPIANIHYNNIRFILPALFPPISRVLSSQVANEPGTSNDTAVQLTFRYSNFISFFDLPVQPICAFWNFSLNEGRGGWDIEGVTVVDINPTTSTIICNSTHLSSFAVIEDLQPPVVLPGSGSGIIIPDTVDVSIIVDVSVIVDVSDGHQDISQEERTALSAVSYVGCGISIVCLLITVIVMVYYRNTLFQGTHNFIHLNLALALLFALITFVSGIGTATESEIGCTIVAALLHYFFTAVFTWMLCEGIMMYFLLVKIFRTDVAEKKLPYLALGWGIPVPIVAISAGVAHDQYGHDDFCWIDTEEGAIWGFVAPMLAIITVNFIFLILTLHSLYKNKRNKMTLEKASQATLVKGILKATIILLPLLGITWVFGLLAVNQESSVFAWIFTVLNSFQGMFIFIFHVIRNDKMWEKISSCWKNKDRYKFISSSLRNSAPRVARTDTQTTWLHTAESAGEDLSISNTIEIQPKSGTSSSLKTSGIQSESQSFGTEALIVEAENEEPDICITEVKPEEEEIIAKPFTVDVKVSTDYDETAL